MSRKTRTILLVITHLLCILLGYCIAMILPSTDEYAEPTEAITEVAKPAEKETMPIEETQEAAAMEETQAPTEETDTTEPIQTAPAYTQPSDTELPATLPPVITPPEQGAGGDNELNERS